MGAILESAIDELARVTDQIESLDPGDLGSMSETLTERSRIAIQIHKLVAEGSATGSPQAIDRLADELNRGAELIRRMEVQRARLRAEYLNTHRTRGLSESVRPAPSVAGKRLDFRG